MAVHKPVNTKGAYFITFTCFRWISLFEITNSYDLVYNWFDILQKNGNSILGFVIMPNHIHLLLHYKNVLQSLNTVIGNGKRFIGYQIIKRLQLKGEVYLIKQMEKAVKPKDKQRNKLHEIWQDSFDVKQCRTERFILQKLNYIHKNPCSGKWKLASNPAEYKHSSAGFYDGKRDGYMVKDYLDIIAELTYEDKNSQCATDQSCDAIPPTFPEESPLSQL